MTTKTDTEQTNSATANRSLYLADNLEVLRGLPSDSFDLIYVDNCYDGLKFWDEIDDVGSKILRKQNKSVWKAATNRKVMSSSAVSDGKIPAGFATYNTYMAIRILEMKRLLKKDGHLVFFWRVLSLNGNYIGTWISLIDCLHAMELGSALSRGITYCDNHFKKRDVLQDKARGSFTSHFHYAAGEDSFCSESIAPNEDVMEVGDQWKIRASNVNVAAGEQPVAMLDRIIQLFTPPDGLVLDPFVGSGTTCLAAEQTGRRWVAIDNQRSAIERTEQRLAERGVDVEHTTDIPKRNDLTEASCV